MRKLIILLILTFIIGIFSIPVFAANDENIYFNMPIQKMLAEPNKDANEVYQIPIEVKALGISSDMNWFKIKISFDLVFLGHYEYEGWVHAPLGDLLKAKQNGEPLPQTAPPQLPY